MERSRLVMFLRENRRLRRMGVRIGRTRALLLGVVGITTARATPLGHPGRGGMFSLSELLDDRMECVYFGY